LINTGLEFHKASNEIAEEALKKTPIVTQSQADEMHREIYFLKKRVSELEHQFASVSDAEKGTSR
jgi:polyhydroxyalkanoate synthesis regulator phasin